MTSRILVSSIVSKPNIIAKSSKHECRCNFRIVVDPSVSQRQQTMLHKHNWSQLAILDFIVNYAEDVQDVSICCGNRMSLKIETIFLNNFLKSFIVVSRFASIIVS
jgi:hypothetical protein